MSNDWASYSLRDSDLTGLWLQPGFVEGVVADRKRFDSLTEAYRHIFRRNLEYAILLWNGIPVRLSYPQDLPDMVTSLISMLEAVQLPTESEAANVFQTPNIYATWQIHTEAAEVTVEAEWNNLPGQYQEALNQLGIIRMPRLAFLCEWKLLLQQLIRAVEDAEAVLTSQEARTELERLRALEAGIAARGRFYQY